VARSAAEIFRWRLQEKAFGGHDKATLRLLKACVQKKTGDQRCQRLKAGTVLIREFAGVRHTLAIAPDGFVFARKSVFESNGC
jgi:hypothetical protein